MSSRITGIIILVVCALVMVGMCVPLLARENDAWEKIDENTRAWYRSLMQPDKPMVSCCGEADAYYADSYESTKDGEYIAIITDTRPPCDGTAEKIEAGCVGGRPHIPPGTKVVIPKNKMKYDAGNPTGHGVVFMGMQYSDDGSGHIIGYNVLCYVVPGGV